MSRSNPLHIPEILHQILNSRRILCPSDLLSASLVNKYWFDVTEAVRWYEVELDTESWVDPYYQALVTQLQLHGALVRILVLKECGADRARFNQLLSTMTRLQTIVIDRVTLYNCPSYHLRALDSMPLSQLRYMALPHISTSSNGIETLLEICRTAQGLRHLDLIDSELEDADLKTVAETCLSLRSLDLSRNELVTFKDFFSGCAQDTHTNNTQPLLLLPSSSISSEGVGAAPDSGRYAVHGTHRGPYPRSTTTLKHDNNNIININNINNNNNSVNIINTADSASSLQSFPEGHQHVQQTEMQEERGGGRGGQPVQKMIKRRPGPKKSHLLKEDQPFMHLQELSLVFCFGIANSEFQSLFRSLCPQNLSSLNLQFTNIEDSGLETLATAGKEGLTRLSLSYCSQITARGVCTLVQKCGSLLELEFLSCDQVSADCFLGPTPWACKRLKRLEFTFHPTVLFTAVNNNNNTNDNTSDNNGDNNENNVTACNNCETKEAGLSDNNNNEEGVDGGGQSQEQTGQTATTTESEETPSTLAWSGGHPTKSSKQTPKEQELCNNGDIFSPEGLEFLFHPPPPPPHPGHCIHNNEKSNHSQNSSRSHAGSEDRNESSFQDHPAQTQTQSRASSVQRDYHAMFRQLKQLSHLRSLHIYNSPLLSGNSSGLGDLGYVEFGAEEVGEAGMALTASTEVVVPSNTPTVVETEEEVEEVEVEEDSLQDTGSSSNGGSSSGYNSGQEYHLDRTDTELSAPQESSIDHPERRIRSRVPTGVQSPPGPWSSIPLAAFNTSRSGSGGAAAKDTAAPIHPFSLRMGLKALGQLRELEALTLYERQPMTIGDQEVRWMSKALPQLVTLQLRGAIEISDRAQSRMRARRPSVRVQVCSLFENVCL